MTPTVLLMSPPWRVPEESDVGIATLLPILRREGLPADACAGTHLFPFTDSDPMVRSLFSAFYFLPYLHPEVSAEQAADIVEARYLENCRLGALDLDRIAPNMDMLRRGILGDIERAGVCLERCVEVATRPQYDVIGLSCTFETQLTAALAVARAVKAARPTVKVALGGAACAGAPGAEVVRVYRDIDVVCTGEGDATIAPLVRALRGERALGEVGGLAWVDEHGELRCTDPPPLVGRMDALPIPDYDAFVDQLERSAWCHRAPKLYFELSRGCWWGQKHLCTFCGLNAEGLAYRRKSAERAASEIATLHDRYRTVERFYATDNILAIDHLREVLPRLEPLAAHPDQPLRMFFEIKSNVTKKDVATFRAAGVDCVQPGIESFSDDVLNLMKKGARGLGQVQTIKWLYEAGIDDNYNVILLNPAEPTAAAAEMLEMAPALTHLPPPRVVVMILERFSPYHTAPADYGIRNMRPRSHYEHLFRAPGVRPDRLAYVFDYDHDQLEDAEHMAAERALAHALLDWRIAWRPRTLFYVEDDDGLTVVDERDGTRQLTRVSGLGLRLFRYLDKVRPAAAIRREFGALADGLLRYWRRRRWLCVDSHDRSLVVIPRGSAE